MRLRRSRSRSPSINDRQNTRRTTRRNGSPQPTRRSPRRSLRLSPNLADSPRRSLRLSPNLGPPTPPLPSSPRRRRPRRSSSLELIASNKPPKRGYRLSNSPGSLDVQLYEGRAVTEIEKQLPQLVDVCTTYDWMTAQNGLSTRWMPGASLQKGYIRNEFTLATGNKARNMYRIKSGQSVFAMLATDQSNRIRGYIKGTIYSTYPKLNTQTRVLVVDLLCGQGEAPVKGAGRILLLEAEAYARSLGINLIMLFSVMDPDTVKFYTAMGFTRMADACHPGSPLNVRARAPESLAAARRKGRPADAYTAAMQGAFYEDFDSYNDTVVMSKCLGAGGAGHFGQGGNNGRLAFPAVSHYAQFARPAVRPAYRRYARVAGRLVPA